MSLIPEEEFKRSATVNLAPMVDFLFLILAVFATMAITRAALFDADIDLVQLKSESQDAANVGYNQSHIVNISVNDAGQYTWITEMSEFLLDGPLGIQTELNRQQRQGALPSDREQVKILLHIDKNARWESIAQAIFAIREAGFQVNPVYEPV